MASSKTMLATAPSTTSQAASSTATMVVTKAKPPLYAQFTLGFMSCAVATGFTNPIDVVKCRRQLLAERSRTNLVMTLVNMVKQEGPFSPWKGFEAAIWRAASYSTIRLGLYEPVKVQIGTSIPMLKGTLVANIMSGLVGGSLGAFAGCPFELTKVRMQSQDYQYRHVVHAVTSIAKESGVTSLWNGCLASMLRSAILTGTQLGTYDTMKCKIKEHTGMQEGWMLHLAGSLAAGIITTTASSPFDVMKTRLMNSTTPTTVAQCAASMYKEGGAASFFRGWVPNYARLGPHTLIMLMVYERMRTWFGFENL